MKINSSLNNSIFRNGIDEYSHINPFYTSLFLTILYVVLLSLYILTSGKIAESISTTTIGLAKIEILKGTVYALLTGVVLFFAIFLTLKKIEQMDNLIINQNKSIISTEPLVMTGIFSASVCHDINNLMVAVVCNIEFLKESKNIDSNDLVLIKHISDASEKLTDLVKRMMNSGKNNIPGEQKLINLSDVLEETVTFAKMHKKISRCEIRCKIQKSVHINMNSTLVERMLMNLMLNAAEATNLTGIILIKLYQEDRFVIIEVHDNGPGIPDNMQEKIFDLFYTSKSEGNGLGLLSLKICAKQHNGEIQLKKSDLGGACFSLKFQ